MLRARNCLLLFLLHVSLAAYALPHQIGEAIYDVEIRSRTQLLIPHSYVKFKDLGDSICIQARAAGYIGCDKTILKLSPGSNARLSFTLNDLPVAVEVFSTIGERILSASVDTRQFGIAAELYGITVMIPAKSWPQPSVKRIKVIEGVFGFAINNTCILEKVGEFVKVTMTVERGYLLTCGRRLFVMVNMDRNLPDESVLSFIRKLSAAENSKNGSSEQLEWTAEFIADMIDEPQYQRFEQSGEPIPRSLKACMATRQEFFKAHEPSF